MDAPIISKALDMENYESLAGSHYLSLPFFSVETSFVFPEDDRTIGRVGNEPVMKYGEDGQVG